MKKIASTVPYVLDDKYLILGIDYGYVKLFGKISAFDVTLDKGRLCIISQCSIQD